MKSSGSGKRWSDVFKHWELIECDFQETYGIDLELARARSWRWFRTRLVGLFAVESRVQRAVYPPTKQAGNKPGREFGQDEWGGDNGA